MISRNLLRLAIRPTFVRAHGVTSRLSSSVAASHNMADTLKQVTKTLSKEFPDGGKSNPEAYEAQFKYLLAQQNMTMFKPDPEKAKAFMDDYTQTRDHAKETSGLWSKITYYVCFPAIILAAINTYYVEAAHAEHREHESHMNFDELPPEMAYQNYRTKDFFWGDGDKTAFWKEGVNRHRRAD
jgi:cytochrome c oxidase subunit 6a